MSSQILSKPLPYIALIIAHIIWGANFVVAKITLTEFPPMSLAFLRFAFAILFLAPFFFAEKKKVKIKKEDLPSLIAIGVLIITLNITFFFEGIKRTTAISASTLVLTVPMLSVLLGGLLLKEKIYKINLLGIAVGFLGALVIVGIPQLITGNFSSTEILGNFLIILASISWVLGSVLSKPILSKYPSMVVTGIAFLTGTVTFLIPAVSEYAKNPLWISQITILGTLGLIYMILLSSISAYFLFEWGLSKTNVIVANLFHYIEPFIAATLAILILEESISYEFLIGAVLIAVGVYLGTLTKAKHHHYKPHRI